MDLQDFRGLQEAYVGVYGDLDESMFDGLVAKSNELEAQGRAASDSALERIRKMRATLGDTSPVKPSSKPPKPGSSAERLKKFKKTLDAAQKEIDRQDAESQHENLDIHDLILSHLMDEGYASTPEAAEIIMDNLSEGAKTEFAMRALGTAATGAKRVAKALNKSKRVQRLKNRAKDFAINTALGALTGIPFE